MDYLKVVHIVPHSLMSFTDIDGSPKLVRTCHAG